MKKIFKFLGSMRFALILLGILAAACALGSFITQGQTREWYEAAYSERMAAAILALHLDDVFHSGWFLGITLFLCLNLLLCSLVRFGSVVLRFKREKDPLHFIGGKGKVSGYVSDTEAVDRIFSGMGFRHVSEGTAGCLNPAAEESEEASGREEDNAERHWKFASKNRWGIWGSWITHLGIMVLIASFGLGQMQKKEYTVYGVPGQSAQIGDTSYVLTIDDFKIDLREDDTVAQYTADITVRDVSAGESRSACISVNHPASMFGMKFYQNSTGWAAKASVYKDGEEIQSEVICAGEYLEVKDKPGLVIMLSAIYPDFYMDAAGPASRSSAMNNPGYLYRAYYMDQVIGMNVLTGTDVITIDEYTVAFTDPQSYTLIQIRRDPFTAGALAGGLVIIAGLFLSFYLQTARLWALGQDDGTWMVTGSSRSGSLFDDRLKAMIEKAESEKQ